MRMLRTIRAAIWVRVSTGEQDTQKDLTALRDYAARLGASVVIVYDVHASAWSGDHRRDLAVMVADAQARKFDVLLFTDISRISREGGVEVLGILQTVIAAGVQIRTLSDSAFTGPLDFGQRLGAFVKGELAHEDSLRKSLAVKRGLVAARLAGKRIGRPPGRTDGPGVQRDSAALKLEQARRRVAGVGVYRKRSRIENGQQP